MGKIFNNKKKKIRGASLLLSHSFIQFFFLFPIEDNVKFKFGGREFILFVLKKKLPMIKLWLKFLIIFRNHSHCLSPVVNSLLDLV